MNYFILNKNDELLKTAEPLDFNGTPVKTKELNYSLATIPTKNDCSFVESLIIELEQKIKECSTSDIYFSLPREKRLSYLEFAHRFLRCIKRFVVSVRRSKSQIQSLLKSDIEFDYDDIKPYISSILGSTGESDSIKYILEEIQSGAAFCDNLFRDLINSLVDIVSLIKFCNNKQESFKTEKKHKIVNFDFLGMRMHNKANLTESELQKTLLFFNDAVQKIKSHGFDIIVYGDVYISNNSKYFCGQYHSKNDTFYIMKPLNNDYSSWEYTIIHELGHRYWYKCMTKRERLEYISNYYLNDSDFMNNDIQDLSSKNWRSKGRSNKTKQKLLPSPTEYGYSNYFEHFAECFVHYCMDMPMPEESSQAFLKAIESNFPVVATKYNILKMSSKKRELLKRIF